jgi:hypothetical protein
LQKDCTEVLPETEPQPVQVDTAAAVEQGKAQLLAMTGVIGGGNTEASAAIGDLLEEVTSDCTEEADSALDAVLKSI